MIVSNILFVRLPEVFLLKAYQILQVFEIDFADAVIGDLTCFQHLPRRDDRLGLHFCGTRPEDLLPYGYFIEAHWGALYRSLHWGA